MALQLCCDERTKNLIVASVCMSMCMMAVYPASSVQNVALAESTNIDLNVGYYSEIVKYVACILVGFIFHPFYKLVGIKVTAATTILLITGGFWVMIWIVNEAVIYFGYFLSGLGAGALWILWPMTVMDNSEESQAQRNMGYWWMAEALGPTVGALINYFYFQNVTTISSENRVMLYSICCAITVIAALVATITVTDITKSSARHRPLKQDEITYVEIDEKGQKKEYEADVQVLVGKSEEKAGVPSPTQPDETNAAEWFRKMAKTKEFWILLLPLIYWGFIWGYFMKMLPTATASISNRRDMIPLTTLVSGAAMLIGATSWNFVARCFNNTVCIILATVMQFIAITLSILIFPKNAASEIVEVGTAETYIKPDNIYLVVIAGLIGLADSGVSIIYYTVAGRVYGSGTSLGFSVNNNGFCVFYIVSMFAPSLFDLHSYCYCMFGAVLLMCLSLTVGLRRFMH